MSVGHAGKFGVIDREQALALSGFDILNGIVEGRLPAPTISRVLNFFLVEVGDGLAVFEGEPDENMLNPAGSVHGGWVLTVIDSATACAAQSTLPAGGALQTTVETKANMTRQILPRSGILRCEGRVIHRGRQILTTEAKVIDRTGKIYAHGTSTIMVLAPRS